MKIHKLSGRLPNKLATLAQQAGDNQM